MGKFNLIQIDTSTSIEMEHVKVEKIVVKLSAQGVLSHMSENIMTSSKAFMYHGVTHEMRTDRMKGVCAGISSLNW